MRPAWAYAFATGAALTLVTTPLLRRLAVTTGFVDRPDPRKVHAVPVPYLGGVGLILSVMAAMLLEGRFHYSVAVVAFGGAALGTVGLLDDDRTLNPGARALAQTAAAAVAVLAGIRIHATGITVIDVLLTVVWIVGITNAFNLLDNMDGLAAGVVAAASGAALWLALARGQNTEAVMAAALAGACLAFLAYNRRPASIFMGDAGSLFLGFLVAVLSIEVSPTVSPPTSFAIPLILVALPVLDTLTVIVSRLRRGRAVSVGGQDHLSHRLVALGWSPATAVRLLVGTQLGFSALAVGAGRRALPLVWALGVSAFVVGALIAYTRRAPVYAEPVVGFPPWLKRGAAAIPIAIVLCAAPALLALARASGPARDGERVATAALDGMGEVDPSKTEADFRRAGTSLAVADRRLRGPLTSLGLIVPGVASNLRASRTLVSSGRQLTAAGADLAEAAGTMRVRLDAGHQTLADLRRLEPLLAEAGAVLAETGAHLSGLDRPYLLPSLRRSLRAVGTRATSETASAERVAESIRLLPAVLGADDPRRYFLAFQNNAELRGSGGLIGNWGELTAEDGGLGLVRFGRLQELITGGDRPRVLHLPEEFQARYRQFDVGGSWQQVNVSPDFPTTAAVITDLYPQSGGAALDGVVAVDPPGLAAALKLTGPIPVEGWPVPVSAENVVDVTLRDAYERFPDDAARVAFLGRLSERVWNAFGTSDLGNPLRVARIVHEAARGGHLQVHLNRPEEGTLLTSLGADGRVPPVRGDSVMVVNQNLSANKVDYYLRRQVRYQVDLDPGSAPAKLSGLLEVGLENQAPGGGLSSAVLGPYDSRFVAGENRTYVSVYSPFESTSAELDGRPVQPESQTELGRRVESLVVSVPPQSSRTLRLGLTGEVTLTEDGWYRLDLPRQPILAPDRVHVSVSVPAGWQIVETEGGLRRDGDREAVVDLTLDRGRSMWLRVDRAGWPRTWERLIGNRCRRSSGAAGAP